MPENAPVNVDGLEWAAARGMGALAEKMGLEFTEFSAAHSVATMPVEGNTQPVGLLHGGAYVVLGETMGSMAANYHAGPGRLAVGLDINATHTSSARTGFVTATCTVPSASAITRSVLASNSTPTSRRSVTAASTRTPTWTRACWAAIGM